jgi:esterase/lipase superfamily enzyme
VAIFFENEILPLLTTAGLFIIFETMQLANVSGVHTENATLNSEFLKREISLDFFLPKNVADPAAINLLLINDGQNMEELGLEEMLNGFYAEKLIQPLFCVGIHAGAERKMEYGVASQPDYLGRGSKASAYTSFIREELIPYIQKTYALPWFREKAMAGFSLGALSALDITLNYPYEFTKAGMFSGSFWWRSIDQTDAEYDDNKHRIIHRLVRNGLYHPGLKFFFQCGNMDETMDRNNNGIIDSIDDTLDLITELVNKGYDREKDIHYMQMLDGRHDIATWARAMPVFLKWGWGTDR